MLRIDLINKNKASKTVGKGWNLEVNFENLIVGRNVFIIFSILTKFQKYQKLITMSSIKYFNFNFFYYKIIHKNVFIIQ